MYSLGGKFIFIIVYDEKPMIYVAFIHLAIFLHPASFRLHVTDFFKKTMTLRREFNIHFAHENCA